MKAKLAKIGRGLLAAITSPTAVAQERSLAAFITGRVIISAGGTAAFAALIVHLIHG
jgi:hypothetical protein